VSTTFLLVPIPRKDLFFLSAFHFLRKLNVCNEIFCFKIKINQAWWFIPIIPATQKVRQED
jgi:hypothetical protein